MKAGEIERPEAFAAHHDKTAAKGLCWECEVKPANAYSVTVNGRRERIESLWCLDCQIALGFIEDATEIVV